MTREEALLNAQLVENYLAWTQASSYVTKEVNRYNVSIHYFNPEKTDIEVKRIAKSMDTIRRADSELEFRYNENLKTLTFNVVWAYNSY